MMFKYHRLKPETGTSNGGVDGTHQQHYYYRAKFKSSSRIWSRLRRVHVRRRVRLRFPGLRMFMRRKARIVAAAARKVVRRLKEGQGHWGDIFAGNYLFLQVNPSNPAKFAVDKPNITCHTNNNPGRSIA